MSFTTVNGADLIFPQGYPTGETKEGGFCLAEWTTNPSETDASFFQGREEDDAGEKPRVQKAIDALGGKEGILRADECKRRLQQIKREIVLWSDVVHMRTRDLSSSLFWFIAVSLIGFLVHVGFLFRDIERQNKKSLFFLQGGCWHVAQSSTCSTSHAAFI